LNCQSNPADYQITIKSSVDGDLVGNINFILNKLDSTTIDKQKAEILPGTALITAGSQPNIEELVNDNIRKNQPIEGSVVVDQPANSKNYIIQFSTKNTTILDIKGTEVLDLITDYLLKNPLLFIDIQGHSCKLDSTELEQNIAIERAATVKNYLISKGIDASKMNIKSVGSSNPLHDNNSEVGKIRNSRVEINIIEK